MTLLTPANDGPIDRIVDHGVVQHPTKLYRVTVDNYLASGGEDFGVLQQGTNRIGGPQDIDALVAYLSATYKSPKSPYDPKDPALNIARQSTWQGRVKHDGKGSRGVWIMPLMIVAGKRYVEG